ncbi:Prophage endopeptidase tail [Fructobacillus sp. EFB-N1]|uniref:prophage endopeptidase tail family protein n=1 Tax=Fructobacillus sp. EFB-N1 TaxID=1658766 RepID=UPI00065CD682|nr:prophage endopeptidase tail family protein [Fructobacillus sp. EFB-N1]KMK52934.1 Prophage endopeptidase tail [Fructobacillus sp. EFB-N1]
MVRSRDQTTTVPVPSLDFSTLQTTWEKNSSYQIAFTAYDDESLAFSLLTVENSVFWAGQEYIIKQSTDGYSGGVHTVQITATHVFYQLNNRRQNTVQKGDVSYTIQSALQFLTGEITGYSFNVVGNLNSSHTITDFGNCSITDGLSTIASTFNVYAIVPDNYTVNLYSEANWTNDVGRQFFYRNNTSDVQLQYDSSGIVNRVQVVSTNETPQFDPFYVTDDDSIKQWGIRDGERVENDKNNNTGPNIASAKAKMVTVPNLTLTVKVQENDVHMGDIWTLVIPENGITTKLQVVSIVDTPFLKNNMQVTLNNTKQNFLDSFNANAKKLANIQLNNNSNKGFSFNIWTVGKVSEND